MKEISFVFLLFPCLCLSQQISQIFSPSPYYISNIQSIENTIQQLVVCDQQGLLFLANGQDGIAVIDQNSFSLLLSIKDKGEIDLLSVTNDGLFMFFPYQGKISMFQLNTQPRYSLNYICSDDSNFGLSITSLFLFNNDKWAAGTSNNILVIYDISSRNQMKIIGQIDVQMIPFYIVYTKNSYLFLANINLIVVRFQLEQNDMLRLDIVFTTPAYYGFQNLVLTNDQYIYAIDSWSGLYLGKFIDLDSIQSGATISKFDFDVKAWWPLNQSPTLNEIRMTYDQKFILIGAQQLGIFIFDISNRNQNISPQLFQWIRSSGYSFSIRLSKDESYLYYVNGIQLQVYQKVTPNLNNDYPNLFNAIQANQTAIGTAIYRWRCYITQNDQFFIGSFDKDGLFIFDLKGNPNNMQLLQQVVPQNIYYTESAIIDEGSGYIITPGDSTGILLFVYQINQIRQSQKLQPVFSLNGNNPNIVMEGIRYNQNKNLIGIAAYTTVFLVDSSNGPLNLKVLSSLQISNQVVELIFSRDNKYILCASRNDGFLVLSIGSKYELQIAKYLKTNGGFCIIQSKDLNYAFVCEGPKGIGIIDLSYLPEIKFISRIQLDGITMQITPLYSDKYLLVSSNIVGFLTLVDIRDLKSIKIISKLMVGDQNGLASCVNQNEQIAILTNTVGVISIPISNQIQVHTEIFLIQGQQTNQISYLKQQYDQTLLIGQTFQFQFYQIYPKNGAKLTNVYFYQNYQVVNLPYWISFNSQLDNINISVVKDALGNDVSISHQNTIILEHKFPLSKNSFSQQTSQKNEIQISPEMSLKIYKQLRIMGILNQQNFLVTGNFDNNQDFRFQDNSMNENQALLEKVRRTLKESICFNPIIFNVANSLRFFMTPQSVPEYSKQILNEQIQKYFIFSIQNDIQVYFEVPKGQGKFVSIPYDGVIAQISNFQTRLKLEGDVKNINKVFENRILFFKQNDSMREEQIIFQAIVSDGVNYDIQTSFKLNQASSFIIQKQPIKLNQNKTLQKQFNQLFQNGQVGITENLAFEFSSDTFLNPDTDIINYSVQFKCGDDYCDSVAGAWIQQSSNSLRFFGSVPVEEYRSIVTIKIEATDGYTQISDTFNIYVYNIPFQYVLSSLIKIFGPILTIFGLYKYRSYFFNFMLNKNSLYSREKVEVFQQYYKKITIMSDENIKAILFYKELVKKKNFNKFREHLQYYLSSQNNQIIKKENNSLKNVKEINNVSQIIESNTDVESKEELFKDNSINSIFTQNHQKNEGESDNNSFLKILLFKEQKILKILKCIKKIILSTEVKENKTLFQKYLECNLDEGDSENKINQKNKLKSKDIKTNEQRNYIFSNFINDQGQIQMKLIIKLMVDMDISIKHQNQVISIKSVIPELVDSSSRLFQCLKGLISRALIKNYPLLEQIYQFLKLSAIIESQFSQGVKNGWYFKYIKTLPEENENDQKLLSFPHIQFQAENIKNQIKFMKEILLSLFKLEKSQLQVFNQNKFPYRLIFNVLIADCYGIAESTPSIFQPSQGESIHQNFFDIHSVQAFKKVENLQCSLFRRFLNLDVMNYGSSVNQQLPSWMKFTLKSNAIVLYGSPKLQDVETFIIRIYDNTNFIVRQFEVEISKQNEPFPKTLCKIENIEEVEFQQNKSKILNNIIPLTQLNSQIYKSQIQQNQQLSSFYQSINENFNSPKSQSLIHSEQQFNNFIKMMKQNEEEYQQVNQIFSPSPYYVSSVQSIENTIQQLVVCDQQGLLFLANGQDGIAIIDQNSFQTLLQIKDKGEVDLLSVTSDGQYMFFQYQGKISMFQLNNYQNYVLSYICSDDSNFGQSITSLFLFNNDKWAAGTSNSILVIYDVSSRSQMKIIGQIDVQMIPFYIVYAKNSYLFLANINLIVVRFQLEQNNMLSLDIVFTTPADYGFQNLVLTSDQYIYAIDSWSGLYLGKFIDLDSIQSGTTISKFDFDVKAWWPLNQSPTLNEIRMTYDQKFILIGAQQLGIFIFDISNRNQTISPQLFQWIRSSGYSFSIRLSKDESYLYYVNGIQLQVYQKVTPNLNNDYPNLFNAIQANQTAIGTAIYRWRCYITQNDQFFIGSFDKDGLFIFDLKGNPNNMQLLQQVVPQNIYYTESAIIDEESGYIITPGDSTGILLFVYQINQISQSQKLQPVFSLNGNNPNIVMEGIRYNQNKNLIGIAAYTTVFLVDSSNGPLNLKVLSSLQISNQVVELIFSKDNKYVLCASRNDGFLTLSIGSKYELQIAKYLKTNGGFCIIQSKDLNYAFVCEGPKGIGIIDLSYLPEIKFTSRIQLDGTTMQITPLYSDKFLLVSSNVVGFLTLVDIRDLKNLKIISKFMIGDQNGLASCVNQNEQIAMLTNSVGVTSIPISNQIQVHTEIFLVQGQKTNQISYLKQQYDQTLLIGQTFQFQFYQIYPKNGAKLTNVYYYQNYVIVNMPFWITFNSQLASVNIQAVKDALGNDVTLPQQNTIILQYQIPITSNSFLQQIPDDGVLISSDMSLQIYKQLSVMGIINYQNFLVTSNFDSNQDFRFQDNSMNGNQALLDKVKRIIKESICYNPIIFNVANSLRFFKTPQTVPEYSQQNQNDKKQEYFVFSIQSYIQIYFEVPKEQGQFVDIYYDGVIAQISNFQTRLKLEGDVKNINNALQNRILFFKQNNNITDDQIEFQATISDGVNYDIQTSFQLSQAQSFIVLKQPIRLNQNNTLQQQFNSIYQNGYVGISDNLAFEFNQDTFINPDTNTIKYSAKFKCGDDYCDSVPGAWIQQSSNSLRFFGTVPVQEYRQVITIKIEVTDGYTSTNDTFQIYIYNIPFEFILSLLIKIFGPILTLFGLYKYRSYFFNFILNKNNLYSSEKVEVFQQYYKKITIMSDENIKAVLFYKALIKKINQYKKLKEKKEDDLLIQKDQNEQQKPQKEKDLISQIQESQINSQQREDILKDDSISLIFEQNSKQKEEGNEPISIQNVLLLKDSKIIQILKKMKNIIQSTNTKEDKSLYQKYVCRQIEQEAEEEIQNVKVQKNQKRKIQKEVDYLSNFINQNFINEQGQIKMKFIIKLMIDMDISIKHLNQDISINTVMPEFVDSSSRLYQCLKGLISRALIKNYPLLEQIYQFLKQSAIIESQFSQGVKNGWYFKYLNTLPEENENDQKLLSFPHIQFQTENIKTQIKMMKKLLQNSFKLEKSQLQVFNQNKFPYRLIFNVLIADCYGIAESTPSIFQPSQGESIHQNFFDIHSVQAFKKVENLQCSLFRRFLNLDVMNYGSSVNQQLPSWMKFTLKSNAIVLYGSPKLQDVETFIIRIYDNTNFIIRQFEVEIQKQNEPFPKTLCKLQNLDDEEVGFTSEKKRDLHNVLYLTEQKSEIQRSQKLIENQISSFCSMNMEYINSPLTNQLIQTGTQRENINSKINLREHEDSPIINLIKINEFQAKQK
ncbi:hypothetical protein ABPG74_017946 [Tetrahymena malaccensis]